YQEVRRSNRFLAGVSGRYWPRSRNAFSPSGTRMGAQAFPERAMAFCPTNRDVGAGPDLRKRIRPAQDRSNYLLTERLGPAGRERRGEVGERGIVSEAGPCGSDGSAGSRDRQGVVWAAATEGRNLGEAARGDIMPWPAGWRAAPLRRQCGPRTNHRP